MTICSQEFLDERMNSKSSRVDLAATYSHIDSLVRPSRA